jgi:hypothetical protein
MNNLPTSGSEDSKEPDKDVSSLPFPPAGSEPIQQPPTAPQASEEPYAPQLPVSGSSSSQQPPTAYSAPNPYSPQQSATPPQAPYINQTVPPALPPKKKNNTVLIIILSIVGFFLVSGFLLIVGLILLVGIGASSSTSTNNDDSDSSGSSSVPPTESSSTEALGYVYGETSEERIVGLNLEPLKQNAGWIFASDGSISYDNPAGTCNMIVNHGYAPEELVNTGDDAQASVEAIKIIFGTTPIENVEDMQLDYVVTDSTTTGIAPFKYVASTLTTGQEAGIWGRVISGSNIAMTLSVVCDSEAELSKANAEIANNVYVWPTETKY